MNEVIALTKFNEGLAIVLRDAIKFNYEKHGDVIIGFDDTKTFVNCLFYERPTEHFKAFAGREFTIELTNGDIIECNGQWWSGRYDKAEKIIGAELTRVTANDIESLERCYVYTGCCGIKEKVEEMINNYKGKVFGYFEFEDSYWIKESVKEVGDGFTRSYMKKIKNPKFENPITGGNDQ